MLNVYLRIRNYIEDLLQKEEGQTLTEYALILVLIAIAVIVILEVLGGRIDAIFNQVVSALGG
ncbi:MAG: Flp family type IVb pilin [Anaerolineae bacterium]